MLKSSLRLIHTQNSKVAHKLILIYQQHKSQVTEALARRIQSELRQVHLNALETDKLIASSHVPYTVVITERTLVDGVLELLHHNPRVKEEVHVSSLTDRLLMQSGSTALRCTSNARTTDGQCET